MDKWDEARVGFAGRQGDEEGHSRHVFKYGIAKVKRRRVIPSEHFNCMISRDLARRSRRNLYLLVSFLTVVIWLFISSISRVADIPSVSDPVFTNCTVSIRASVDVSRNFRLRLMDCLSFKDCPWLFRDASDVRDLPVEMDEEYLEPEHLALPRSNEPYSNIDKWSTEKKRKTLDGLEWLLQHYNDRWHPE